MHGLKQLVYDDQPFFPSNQSEKTNQWEFDLHNCRRETEKISLQRDVRDCICTKHHPKTV